MVMDSARDIITTKLNMWFMAAVTTIQGVYTVSIQVGDIQTILGIISLVVGILLGMTQIVAKIVETYLRIRKAKQGDSTGTDDERL